MMKFFNYGLLLFILLISLESKAQELSGFRLKAEYIPLSRYIPETKVGETGQKTEQKSDMRRLEGAISIPLSMKVDSLGRAKVWAVTLGGSYAKIKNQNYEVQLFPDELLNASVGLMHLRPLGKSWNMLFMASAGVYTDLKGISSQDILVMGGVIFIKQFNPNLALGVGPVVSNTFGIPMVLPAIFLNWKTNGKFQVMVNFPEKVELAYKASEGIKLKVVAEVSAMTADVGRKDKAFLSYLQVISGFQPEFKLNKSLSLQLTAGASLYRSMEFTSRKLKDFFKDKGDVNPPHFETTAYGAVGLKWNLGKR
ncbi:DUF6268 family outer membrane beta-barrel protein [Pedobacter sp. PLR]|uniref:DUF6268 family outer membrane beta-barrel protein n=1 Tax=Pedobacter sp. PLR TaxID=2994465 RepID=UPI002246AA36|nr:DUF6268 family outer membrane beta-barrel protein [Pedobacter sp. PLR]MCX2454101.1 DUF6268 family outer membrane beta-barrel protein [Pedobacter sp. PLR]